MELAENRSFSGSGRPRGPRDPLRSTEPAPHIHFHEKSAPKNNSKAISRGFSKGALSDLMENRSFWGSGRPQAAQKPFKKVGGLAPHLFKGFLGRPGPPKAPK